MLGAAEPPDPPSVTQDEARLMQRTTTLVVEATKRWQIDHGDRTLPWDQAQGHLAIVIDDVGRELHLFEQLLALRYRLTFSVLPGSIYAAGVQLRLQDDRRRYREILLHLPMEPNDATQMHQGAEIHEQFLKISDSVTQRRAKLQAALDRVPTAVGFNNHMGSALTRDVTIMREIMDAVRSRELFFLDSRTIGDSQAQTSARERGIPTAARDVFLDHDPSGAAIEAALDRAAQLSRDRPVIAIAHPSSAVVEVLGRRLPALYAQGVIVYPLSRLIVALHALDRDESDPAAAVPT